MRNTKCEEGTSRSIQNLTSHLALQGAGHRGTALCTIFMDTLQCSRNMGFSSNSPLGTPVMSRHNPSSLAGSRSPGICLLAATWALHLNRDVGEGAESLVLGKEGAVNHFEKGNPIPVCLYLLCLLRHIPLCKLAGTGSFVPLPCLLGEEFWHHIFNTCSWEGHLMMSKSHPSFGHKALNVFALEPIEISCEEEVFHLIKSHLLCTCLKCLTHIIKTSSLPQIVEYILWNIQS